MDDAHHEGEHQHFHGLIHWLEPQGRQGNVGASEEGGGDDIHRIAEEGAEKEAPEGRGNAAVEEHMHELPHALLHPGIFPKAIGRGQHHDDAVGRIGKHQAEANVVKCSHNRGGIQLTRCRQAVAFHHALHRCRKGIVLELHRRHLVRRRIPEFQHQVQRTQLAGKCRRILLRHPALQHKGVL